MGQALLGIGAGAAGAFGPAYDAARRNRQQSQMGDIDIQGVKDTMEGQVAWANAAKLAGLPQHASALQGVGGGGLPGQEPPGMPGQPQQLPKRVPLPGNQFMPQQGPPRPQMRGSMMPMPQGMPQGTPQLGAPPPPGMVNPGRIGNQPQNLTGPTIMPQQAPSAGLTPAGAPGGGGPLSSSPPPPGGLRGRAELDPRMQGRGGMPQPTHLMTAQQMAQWIAQHNPSISPGALAKAVEFGMKQAVPENRIAYLEQQLASREAQTMALISGRLQGIGMQQEGAGQRTGMQQEGAMKRNPTAEAFQKFMEEKPDASSKEQQDFIKNFKPPSAAGAEKGPSATQLRITNQAQRYDAADELIDDAFKDIQTALKSGLSPTGVGGQARRLSEVMTTLSGLSDKTIANQFAQKIELLRNEVPRLLTGSSITNKDERARILNIVKGLEAGSTTAITIDDLKYLQKHLKSLRPKAGVIESKGEAGGKSKVITKEEYDALPSGSEYTAPDGSVRTKK